MRTIVLLSLATFLGGAGLAAAARGAAADRMDAIPTSRGDLQIHFLNHASLYFVFEGRVIQVDPFGEAADYSKLPKADLVLVTHEHFDHCDPKAVAAVRKAGAVIAGNAACASKLPGAVALANGDEKTLAGIPVRAVAAYNVEHKRPNGQPFHPKGDGNGYLLTFGDKRVYIAGDTELIPEMKSLGPVDVAFLPVNLPYTMDIPMAVRAAEAIRPKILYPYHMGETDAKDLENALKKVPGVEVRMREMR